MYGFSDSTGNECDEFIFTFETETKVSLDRPIPNSSSLSIYPNPGKDFITISGKNLNNSSVELLDITGKNVFAQIAEQSECKIILNIQSIPNGTYLIRIRQNKAVSQLRLIKV